MTYLFGADMLDAATTDLIDEAIALKKEIDAIAAEKIAPKVEKLDLLKAKIERNMKHDKVKKIEGKLGHATFKTSERKTFDVDSMLKANGIDVSEKAKFQTVKTLESIIIVPKK